MRENEMNSTNQIIFTRNHHKKVTHCAVFVDRSAESGFIVGHNVATSVLKIVQARAKTVIRSSVPAGMTLHRFFL